MQAAHLVGRLANRARLGVRAARVHAFSPSEAVTKVSAFIRSDVESFLSLSATEKAKGSQPLISCG